ncbi:hypothetical protein K474DRAFT_793716, partial [Panus rudis PR-1116 ss-1]
MHSVKLLLTFALICLLMGRAKFPCVEACTKGPFDTQRQLAIHEATCTVKIRHENNLAARLSARLDASREWKKAEKARKKAAKVAKRAAQTANASQIASSMDIDPHTDTLLMGVRPNHDGHDLIAGPAMMVVDDPTEPSAPAPFVDASSIQSAQPVQDEGRPVRIKRPTWKILEQLPTAPAPIVDDLQTDAEPATPIPTLPNIVLRPVQTAKNIFGLFREYMTIPSFTPDFALSDVSTSPHPVMAVTEADETGTFLEAERNIPRTLLSVVPTPLDHADHSLPADSEYITIPPDCENPSIYLLMVWMWTGSSTKSQDELNRLVHKSIKHPSFNVSELDNFDAGRETAKIDAMLADKEDGWRESTVKFRVPDGRSHGHRGDDPVPVFPVPGLLHRSIVEVIKSAWSSATSSDYHYIPFRQYWQRDDGTTERVHDELYASEAFNTAYEDLQRQPPEPGCTLERVVCGLMFWSDS